LTEQKKRLEEKQLASLSGEDTAEAGSKKSYEGYRRTLRNHNIEIVDETEAIESLRNTLIPAAQKNIYDAETALKLSLRNLCTKQAKEACVEMNEIIEKYIAINDEQHAAVMKLYADYGFTVGVYDTGVFAEITSDRIANIKVVPKMIMFSQAPISKPPKVVPVIAEPTKPEKLIVPIDDAEQLKKQADEWKDNAFRPTLAPTAIEIVNLGSGDETGTNASVEVITDTIEKTEKNEGV
jgi:hypothetical protein